MKNFLCSFKFRNSQNKYSFRNNNFISFCVRTNPSDEPYGTSGRLYPPLNPPCVRNIHLQRLESESSPQRRPTCSFSHGFEWAMCVLILASSFVSTVEGGPKKTLVTERELEGTVFCPFLDGRYGISGFSVALMGIYVV